MLAPLGFYLVLTVIACSTILLVCWAHDAHSARIEAGRTHPSELELDRLSVPTKVRQVDFGRHGLSGREGVRGRHRGGPIPGTRRHVAP